VYFVSLVSNSDQRLNQKVLRNLLSQSKMVIYGNPKWTHNRSKNILVVSSIVIFFLKTMRMAIFENQSMNTNTQSFPCLVDERPDM
jgi:hypothetical protein